MDGIAPLKNVVVIAATNRPDIMDPALLRPGRFDRIVYVPPPDEETRLEILRVHTRRIKISEEMRDDYLRDLARRTEGYTGADLAALVREAAMLALRELIRSGNSQGKVVDIEHFEEALKRVPPSLSKSEIAKFEEVSRNLRGSLRGG
jgi:transitional endoplasmic reticulum ATPase